MTTENTAKFMKITGLKITDAARLLNVSNQYLARLTKEMFHDEECFRKVLEKFEQTKSITVDVIKHKSAIDGLRKYSSKECSEPSSDVSTPVLIPEWKQNLLSLIATARNEHLMKDMFVSDEIVVSYQKILLFVKSV